MSFDDSLCDSCGKSASGNLGPVLVHFNDIRTGLRQLGDGENKQEWWCKECRAAKASRKSRTTPYERQKDRQLKQRFGVSLDWVNRQHEMQEFRCAICGYEETTLSSQAAKPRSLTVMKIPQLVTPVLVCASCFWKTQGVDVAWAKSYLQLIENPPPVAPLEVEIVTTEDRLDKVPELAAKMVESVLGPTVTTVHDHEWIRDDDQLELCQHCKRLRIVLEHKGPHDFLDGECIMCGTDEGGY